jgi:hypothetical protein
MFKTWDQMNAEFDAAFSRYNGDANQTALEKKLKALMQDAYDTGYGDGGSSDFADWAIAFDEIFGWDSIDGVWETVQRAKDAR